MPRPFTSYILAPSWPANQQKLHTCERATHCFISHILGFSRAEGGKIQVSPGWLSANVRAETPVPCSVSGERASPLVPDDRFGDIAMEENSIR